MKMAGTGATFPSTPGAQRVLETSLLVGIAYITVSEEHIGSIFRAKIEERMFRRNGGISLHVHTASHSGRPTYPKRTNHGEFGLAMAVAV
jgi:hypothetical protein